MSTLPTLLGLFALLLILLLPTHALAAKPKPAPATQRVIIDERTPRKRIALVIGNGLYSSIPALPNALNDANDMCKALKELNFQVICKNNLHNKREFKDLIYAFTQKLDSDTNALFYYAGHGMEVDGVNYLLPTDTLFRTKSDIQDEGFNINYLMSELDDKRTELNILILDACRNDPLGKQFKDSPFNGLAAQFNAPPNSVIMFATTPGKIALDGSGRNGIFTRHLLTAIRTPNIPIETALKNIIAGVREESTKAGSQQTPWINFSYSGRFCFAGCNNDSPTAKEMIERKEAPAATPKEAEMEQVPPQKNRDASSKPVPKYPDVPVIPVF